METTDQAARTSQHPNPDHTAELLRRELADALIHPAIIPAPRRTVLLLTHDGAERLLRILQGAHREPW